MVYVCVGLQGLVNLVFTRSKENIRLKYFLCPKQTKENAELRRHVKRRTQALDTIRRAYIVDVEHLKRDLRDQVRFDRPPAPRLVSNLIAFREAAGVRRVETENPFYVECISYKQQMFSEK